MVYGVNSNGFGMLLNTKLVDFDMNQIDLDEISIIILQDSTTRIKRYIFGMTYRALLVKNSILGFYKTATFTGKDGSIIWTYPVSYIDAEIFTASPVHVLQMVGMASECCKRRMPLWQIDNKIKEYAEKYVISCFTNVPFQTFITTESNCNS